MTPHSPSSHSNTPLFVKHLLVLQQIKIVTYCDSPTAVARPCDFNDMQYCQLLLTCTVEVFSVNYSVVIVVVCIKKQKAKAT